MSFSKGQRRLAGKVAVVTGAGAGIGRGCALMFAAQGATVIGLDLDEAAVVATVKDADGHMEGRSVDLLDDEAVDATIARIGEDHGRIDILVSAAAVSVMAWLEDMSFTDWRKTIHGELDIVFLITKAAWPFLKQSGRASIINFGSVNAHQVIGSQGALSHCASKGGVVAMTRQLALEGAEHGIRANTISPGLIATQATKKHMDEHPEVYERAIKASMIQRIGEPEDIAWCATWLASDEASFVTASDFAIDGGSTAL